MEPLAFYCVCDRNHFLGLAALIDSLRLVGHGETVYVLDCGLEPEHRRLLQGEAVVEEAHDDLPPVLMRNVLPRRRPAEVMVVVDVDVIFTRPIRDLAEQARGERKPILFLNDRTDRFHAEWETLGFGPPVRHEYLAAGQYVLPSDGTWFVDVFDEALLRLDVEQTLVNPRIRPRDPFYYSEMDVLNALIGTAIPLDSFAVADRDLVSYWPFRDLRVDDERTLECVRPDGSRPALLHHILAKPWAASVAPNPYTRLMTRLLCGSDAAVRVPPAMVPRRLRPGALAEVVRRTDAARAWGRQNLRGKLGIKRRLRAAALGARGSA